MKKSKIIQILVAVVIFIFGYVLGGSDFSTGINLNLAKAKRNAAETIADVAELDDRKLVLMEHPELVGRILEGGAFGSKNFSISAAQNMFNHDQEIIEDVADKTEISTVAKNIWVIRLPIVNCFVVQTTAGLVIIDTGMGPAGPAILQSIKSVTDSQIHTIIYTHGHVDHAYGTWALIDEDNSPQIIAHENIISQFERYIQLNGSLAKYMSQPVEQLPKDSTDIVWPTRTFSDDLEITIGKTKLYLKHFEGETDDQLIVWLPDEQILFPADFYQGFLPNAGNGKRVQRNVSEWIKALEYMVELQPKMLVPSHGEVINDQQEVANALFVHASALSYIFNYTLSALNKGKRKNQIVHEFLWPERFATHPLLHTQYVTAQDICKMIIEQYTGWWDDIPSHWSPASFEDQSKMIVELSGGIGNMMSRINELEGQDIVMASHLADWAFFADPKNPEVQEVVLEIYHDRIMDERSMTQEMLVYLDHMTIIRAMMK